MIAFLLFLIDIVLFGICLVNLGFSLYDHNAIESMLNFTVCLLALRCVMYDYQAIENEKF